MSEYEKFEDLVVVNAGHGSIGMGLDKQDKQGLPVLVFTPERMGTKEESGKDVHRNVSLQKGVILRLNNLETIKAIEQCLAKAREYFPTNSPSA